MPAGSCGKKRAALADVSRRVTKIDAAMVHRKNRLRAMRAERRNVRLRLKGLKYDGYGGEWAKAFDRELELHNEIVRFVYLIKMQECYLGQARSRIATISRARSVSR